MVDDFVLATKLRVFVLQRVEAVWAAGHNALHTRFIERVDVGLRLLLEQELVARAPRRITGARLLLTEDGEVDARGLEQARRAARDLLGAVVVRGGAADPIEDLGVALLGERGDLEALAPRRAVEAGARLAGFTMPS